MLEKLKSRKFLMALVSVIVGIMGMAGAADSTIQMVSSIALVLIPTVIYIAVEGKIDQASVGQILTTIDDITDVIQNNMSNEEKQE